MADGSSRTVPLLFKNAYKDEYTSEALPSARMQSAMQDEIDDLNCKVRVGITLKDALSDPAAKAIGTRWVVCNKNDADDPDIRARLVAKRGPCSRGSVVLCGNTAAREHTDAPFPVGHGAKPMGENP